MNSKRNKRGPVRTQRNRSVAADGVYNNAHFMHTAASQIGTVVRLKTKGEDVWEGVFKTFSSNFEVVLEVATLIGKHDSPNATAQIGTLVERLIFPASDVVSISAKDVDLDYPTRDTFQTDAAISARLNGASREEKELEPWEEELNGTDTPLELDSSANGWDPTDMFKKNELEYGVTSTFDHSLKGYTVPLQHSDSADYKEAEAKANQIANEIESQPSRKARLELENGDEETIYAAVARPNESNGKYIPPAKRKNQNSGKMARNSSPPNNLNNSTTSLNSVISPPQSVPSKGVSQTSSNSYSQNVVNNAPPQNIPTPQAAPAPQAQMQPQTQAPVQQQQMPAQAQTQSQPPVVQNQAHQPRQNHYANRQGGQKGQHMNGESKQMLRGPRNVYQSGPPQNVVQQPPTHPIPAYQGADMQPKMVEMNHNHRHEIKELQQFSADFQLGAKEVSSQGPPAQPNVPEQQVVPQCTQPQQQALKSPTQVSPSQPSPPPQHDAVMEKVTTTLKKSTLNPNAKEFVLNPSAKPFMPSSRSPSTPSLSRPHTPQTPSHAQFISNAMNGPMGQPPTSMIVPVGYVVPGQPQYSQQPQNTRARKIPVNQVRNEMMPSPMQVTGQPLLAPGPPISQFVYPGLNPTYHQMHGMRMYESPPQIQYMPPQVSQAGTQSTQPQFAQNQPPQAPPQQYQTVPPPQGGVQTHQYLPMCNLIPQPHIMQGMQYLPQVPPPPHQIPHTLILHNQHQVHQGPA